MKIIGNTVGTPISPEAVAKQIDATDLFGATVKIVGGEKESDTGRVEVDRDFETYAASNRKFAAYDYNGFFAKDKLVNGKPLFVDTLVWQELQLDAYSNQNVATDLIAEDYNANPEKYYDDGDCIRRDIHIHYPMKDGQVAIIEKGGVLRVYNLESENVNTGVTKTGWVIFENDDAKNGSPNRMFNEYWDLYKLWHISAPKADAAFKNVRTQAVYAPWLVFDNDGGTEATYNRLYNDWWKLNKLQSIYAPHCVATFDNVVFRGENLITKFSQLQSEITELKKQVDELKAALNSQTGGE